MPPDVLFFPDPPAWRRWLEKNHATATELWVGFYKRATGKPSITWSEAVDQALCFGWIDGVRKSIDATSYKNRFTPRKPGSNWSRINIAKVKELEAAGLMRPAGRAAFEARRDDRSMTYSYEQRDNPIFDPALEKKFRANKDAWAWFQTQPPGYRKLITFWVVSAKRDETRRRRLDELIELCAKGKRHPALIPRKPKRETRGRR
jgi:uncharacterized protein YdeI (YjbR/CyaY-like superfamily)